MRFVAIGSLVPKLCEILPRAYGILPKDYFVRLEGWDVGIFTYLGSIIARMVVRVDWAT